MGKRPTAYSANPARRTAQVSREYPVAQLIVYTARERERRMGAGIVQSHLVADLEVGSVLVGIGILGLWCRSGHREALVRRTAVVPVLVHVAD